MEKTERVMEGCRDGRVQNEDLDLPRWTVSLEEIDRLVVRQYCIEEAALKGHGHRAGPAKAVAVELACRLAGELGVLAALRTIIARSRGCGTVSERSPTGLIAFLGWSGDKPILAVWGPLLPHNFIAFPN